MEKGKIASPCKMLVIGGSAGSIEVILKLLPDLKADLSFPIVIVLHRKNSADSTLGDLFATRTRISVKEVEDKDEIKPGCIYMAPADYHLLFETQDLCSLDFSEKVNYSRPSIDVTFESASELFGTSLVCLLLSGANADGVAGLGLVKRNGGLIAAQDPGTAESPFMPQNALDQNEMDVVLNTKDMAAFINAL